MKSITCLNSVELIGMVGSVKKISMKDKKFIHFSLCTTECFFDAETKTPMLEVTWHNIQAFDSPHVDFSVIQPGNGLHILGKLREQKYTDSDNKEITSTVIVATYVAKVEEEQYD